LSETVRYRSILFQIIQGLSYMAKNAITELQDQIEIIRQEAYNEGYAAAMQAVLNFAKQPAQVSISKAPVKAPARKAAKTAAPKTPSPTQARASRGNNAALTFDALKGLPDHAGRAADIRKALSATEVDLAFTSIRHALGQLQARGQVTVAEDGKTWRATA
jgi:hypothetical protein